jgi:putative flippase GtrA
LSSRPDLSAPAARLPRRARFAEWIRHNAAAVLATAADYLTMIGCVELAGLAPVAATPIGALVGAITSFTANRHFTYHGAATVGVRGQAWRYALVSATSLGLNTAGEYLFHHVWCLQYMLARVITSVIVSNIWNYPTMKYFVFSTGPGR